MARRYRTGRRMRTKRHSLKKRRRSLKKYGGKDPNHSILDELFSIQNRKNLIMLFSLLPAVLLESSDKGNMKEKIQEFKLGYKNARDFKIGYENAKDFTEGQKGDGQKGGGGGDFDSSDDDFGDEDDNIGASSVDCMAMIRYICKSALSQHSVDLSALAGIVGLISYGVAADLTTLLNALRGTAFAAASLWRVLGTMTAGIDRILERHDSGRSYISDECRSKLKILRGISTTIRCVPVFSAATLFFG
uniref:Uncharacterized protein n=1 Tax=viral metagenome TaxID=1070528 RepID=A0A6C0F816_9ZZZZ